MKNIAFYLQPEEITYFKYVINQFDKDMIDIHVSNWQNYQASLSNIKTAGFQEELKFLSESGYSVYPLDRDKINQYDHVIMTSVFCSTKQKLFDWNGLNIQKYKNRFLGLIHSVDTPIIIADNIFSYFILASSKQAELYEEGKINRNTNPALFKQLMALPKDAICEYTYTGLYHIGTWTNKRYLPRDILIGWLEEKLSCNFDPHKPVVSFFYNKHNDKEYTISALQEIAKYTNLVIKTGGGIPPIEGAFIWRDMTFAPNLLRFASDFILASYHSGTLTSATMLGLKVIPYYTPDIFIERKKASYKDFMPDRDSSGQLCVQVIKNLNAPIDIGDTFALLERMEDTEYWNNYKLRLPLKQKEIFGEYAIEDADRITKKTIMNAFNKDTFGKNIVAVKKR